MVEIDWYGRGPQRTRGLPPPGSVGTSDLPGRIRSPSTPHKGFDPEFIGFLRLSHSTGSHPSIGNCCISSLFAPTWSTLADTIGIKLSPRGLAMLQTRANEPVGKPRNTMYLLASRRWTCENHPDERAPWGGGVLRQRSRYAPGVHRASPECTPGRPVENARKCGRCS